MAMPNQQNTNRSLQAVDTNDLATDTGFDARKIDLIKNRYFVAGAGDDELELFLTVASRRGLDPTKNHIYAVERRVKDPNTNQWGSQIAYQVSIDGLRLIAERSGRYEGQTAPQWCGTDGQWRDVWLDDAPPAAARIGIYKRGFREPVWSVARYKSYVQTTRDNKPTRFWASMPDVMLAKCAESLALRKAFPEETGGLYTGEEMGQADSDLRRDVDYDTGEIRPQRPAEPPRQAIKATAEVVDEPDQQPQLSADEDHQRAIRHIHAAARDVGISHHVLSEWAKQDGQRSGKAIESMKQAPTKWLDGTARWIKNHPDDARKQAAQIAPLPMDDAIEAALASATPTNGNDDPEAE